MTICSTRTSNSKVPILQDFIAYLLNIILNKIFYQEEALKLARLRLIDKVLVIDLKELSQPLTLIFYEQRVNVIHQCSIPPDCVIKTALITLLLHFKDKKQLSALINDATIVIIGDIQVLQNCSALFDAAEWDLAHYLTPYVSDVIAEGISRWVKKNLIKINWLLNQQKKYFKDVLVEEWRIFPNILEILSFTNKVDKVIMEISKLEQRLAKLEEKYETGRN